MFIFLLFFFITIFNYYFSEKNMSLIKKNRTNLTANTIENISKLPVLPNDTHNVIEFNSGFKNSNDRNFKRNFWELFK